MTHALLICLHLLAAALWVGGMLTMHAAVRPAAVATLPPPQRLPFMAAALQRFLDLAAAAIAVLLASGALLIVQRGGFAALHVSAHAMTALGLVMTAVYLFIRLRPFALLRQAVAAAQWPVAAAALDRVRRLVLLNLVLGTGVFGIALVGRVL